MAKKPRTAMIAQIKNKLNANPALSKVFGNSAWLIFDRITRMVTGLLIGAWIARHLGPHNIGEMAQVMALVGFVAPLATLGLDALCVKRLIDLPSEATSTLATVFIMRLVAGMLAWCGVMSYAWLAVGDSTLWLYLAIFGATLMFSATDTIDLWFQSALKSRLTVFSKNLAFFITAALRVGLVLAESELIWFIAAAAFEVALGALFLLLTFLREDAERMQRFRPSAKIGKELLLAGWPVVVSGLLIATYMKVDQVLIGALLTKDQLGHYSVAMRLIDVWQIIPLALVPSFAPLIAQLKLEGCAPYEKKNVLVFRLVFYVGVAGAAMTALLSPFLVGLLFGEQYAAAVPVVQVAALSLPGMFLGVALGPWVVNEGLMKFSMIRALTGAAVSVGMNLMLLPKLGIIGAALSLVAAQFASNVLVLAFFKQTRRASQLQLEACLFIRRKDA